MNDITLDSTNFSDQLGLFDFFNVIVVGATFLCSLSVVSREIRKFIFSNLSFPKVIALTLMVYIFGMLLQEMGSIIDKYIFKIYKGMNQSILKGNLNNDYTHETNSRIVKNPLVLKRYRKTADKLLEEFNLEKDTERFNNKYTNGYVFSVCQYYVSVYGKDKKVEKLRALFAMSESLVACFFSLSILMVMSIILDFKISGDISSIISISISSCKDCFEKFIWSSLFAIIGLFFVFRAKRVMKNFLLILLGTYDAIVRINEIDKSRSDKTRQKK